MNEPYPQQKAYRAGSVGLIVKVLSSTFEIWKLRTNLKP